MQKLKCKNICVHSLEVKIDNNIISVFLEKMLLNEFLIWTWWDQNVGPGWVKNRKNGGFHTSHLPINPVFPKTKVCNSHSLLMYYVS